MIVDKGVRYLKANGIGRSDARQVQEAPPYGVDSVPANNTRGYYVNTLTCTTPNILIGYENQQVKAAQGETRIYSTDADGAFKYNVWLKASGEVLIGDSDNPSDYDKHLTQYEELKTAFDKLRDDFNDFVNTKYNLHSHPATSGTTSPTTTTGTPSTANMSAAKINHIKTKA